MPCVSAANESSMVESAATPGLADSGPVAVIAAVATSASGVRRDGSACDEPGAGGATIVTG